MKRRAITLLELLVVVAIVAILSSLGLKVFAQAKRRAKSITDVSNMRQLYAAVTMYENDQDGQAPEILPLVMTYIKDEHVFSSVLDPRKQNPLKAGWNPSPCGAINDPRSPYRVSYAYLRASMPETAPSGDKFDYGYWRATPDAGMLASPWIGDIVEWMHDPNDDSDQGPVMKGPIDRVNMDGSYTVLHHRRYEDCLGGCTYDLFFNRN